MFYIKKMVPFIYKARRGLVARKLVTQTLKHVRRENYSPGIYGISMCRTPVNAMDTQFLQEMVSTLKHLEGFSCRLNFHEFKN